MSTRTGRRVAQWVAERVAEVAPAGLGHWPPAWEIVEEPSHVFLDALATWVETGSAEDQGEASRAGGRVVAAWREAARRWEEAGCPRPEDAPAGDREPAGVAP